MRREKVLLNSFILSPNAVRYVVRSGIPWRMMPKDLPPWNAAYQQIRRWMDASCFEMMIEELRLLLREFSRRAAQSTAVVIDSHTLQSTPKSGAARWLGWGQAAQRGEGSCGGRQPGPFVGKE